MNHRLAAWSEALKTHWAAWVFSASLVAGIALSWTFLSNERLGFQNAAAESARCRQLAQRILQLRPDRPIDGKLSPGTGRADGGGWDSTRKIEQSATAAGIAPENVQRIEHQVGQRSGGSTLLRIQTEITLQGVSLPQLIEFLQSLASGADPLTARSLSLSPSAGAPDDASPAAEERWDVGLSVIGSRAAEPLGSSSSAARGDEGELIR